MRLILILFIAFWTLNVNGQFKPFSLNKTNISKNVSIDKSNIMIDSIPSVKYIKDSGKGKPAAFYINGEIINSSVLKTIDYSLIDSMKIEKNEIQINGENYYGQIFLKMKNDYHPKIISLNDLRLKYINPSDKPVLFMIDNDIIKGDYENYMIDENFILKILVDNFMNEKLDIEIIQLLTRTEKNIKDSKKIVIRGLDEITMN